MSAASGGATFRFQGGVPVRTSTSAGPIFAERAQTLGHGRVLAGITRTGAQFRTFRGMDLDNVPFTFSHENSDFPGCDAIVGGDCTVYGVPELENETIDLNLALDINLTVTAFLVTYGITDRVDMGVVLPIVTTSLEGTSDAQINPFAPPPALHFFGGTADNPVLRRPASSRAPPRGSATWRADQDQLAERRAAVGRRAGGDPVPHRERGRSARIGRLRRTGPRDRFGAVRQLLAPCERRVPLSRWRFRDRRRRGHDRVRPSTGTVGDPRRGRAVRAAGGGQPLALPGVAVLEAPYRRTISPSMIPDRRDDIVNASFGVKLTTVPGLTVIANGQWPLNRGGLRANAIWTAGLEYNF